MKPRMRVYNFFIRFYSIVLLWTAILPQTALAQGNCVKIQAGVWEFYWSLRGTTFLGFTDGQLVQQGCRVSYDTDRIFDGVVSGALWSGSNLVEGFEFSGRFIGNPATRFSGTARVIGQPGAIVEMEGQFVSSSPPTGSTPPSPATSFQITGLVQNGDNGIGPVQGALITATAPDGTSKSTRSDSQGIYSFESLPPNTYEITAELDDHLLFPSSQSANITADTELAPYTAFKIPQVHIRRAAAGRLDSASAGVNFLPPVLGPISPGEGGAGLVGNSQNLLIVAAEHNDEAYVNITVSFEPRSSGLRDRLVLAVTRSSNSEIVATGRLTNIENGLGEVGVPLNALTFSPTGHLDDYKVGAWLDFNRNGQIDPKLDEALVRPEWPHSIKFVSATHYAAARSILGIGSFLVDPLGNNYPIASDFLHAFVSGSEVQTASSFVESTICDNGQLDHNVGVNFDNDGCGQILEYRFETNNVSNAILNSSALRKAVENTLALARNDLILFRLSNLEEIEIDLLGNNFTPGDGSGKNILAFKEDDPDLALSFGDATIDKTILHINKRDHDTIRVSGSISDLYDWRYSEDKNKLGDRLALAVQAGYPTLGPGGRVFLLRAIFSGSISGVSIPGNPFLSISTRQHDGRLTGRISVHTESNSAVVVEESEDLTNWVVYKELVAKTTDTDIEFEINTSEAPTFFRVRSVIQ